MTVPGEVNQDFRVAQNGTAFTVTDMATNEESTVNLHDYKFEHNSLIELGFGDHSTKLQLLDH